MGAFDKFLDILKIDNDEDDYESYDEYDNSEEDISEQKSNAFATSPQSQEVEKPKKISKSSGMNKQRKGYMNNMEVVRVEPGSIEDGRKISDYLLEEKVGFLDLEGIDMNLAQRIIDFVSGATYSINGTLQQMSKYTFVIAPPAVSVSGDFQESASQNTSVTF